MLEKMLEKMGFVPKKDYQKLQNQLEIARPTLDQNKLKKWSLKVRKGARCDICHIEENLEAHHLWSKTAFPILAYEYDNGIALCAGCHEGLHKWCPDNNLLSPKVYNAHKIFIHSKQSERMHQEIMKDVRKSRKAQSKRDKEAYQKTLGVLPQ